MALFSDNTPKAEKRSGILNAFSVDTIKWEPGSDAEASIIAHKHIYEDFPNGSYLIVGPSQMAVFTNNLASGASLGEDDEGSAQVSVFVGPCKIKLETGDSRFSPFRSITHALTSGESAFHSTVYFVNTTYMNELSWGTQSPVVVEDPEEGINIHVRAFGLFGAHIDQINTARAVVDARRFLQKVVGTRSDFTRDELISFMRAKILEYVPDLLAKNIVDNQIGILKISTHYSEFSQIIYEKLIDQFAQFGLTLDNFSFTNINAPDEDLRAINEMKIQKKRSRLEAEGNAAQMDIESEARQRMRAREGYTYQQEQAFNVMNAAAGNEGTASTFTGAGMGLGMGVGLGGIFGNSMSNMMSTAFANAAPKAEITCPVCGAANPSGARFCTSCGHKLASEQHCPDCGAVVTPGARFCSNCGKSLVQTSKICPQCGSEVEEGTAFCPQCGKKL